MNKFNAQRVKADGYTFDSLAEHRRYCELKLLEKAGEIEKIIVHPSFPIVVRGKNICYVELDFSYRIRNPKRPFHLKYEDVKGFDTAVSKLKRKLFHACYPELELEILHIRPKH